MSLFSYLDPAPEAKKKVPASEVKSVYTKNQISVFFAIYLGYAGFYIVRNIVKVAQKDIIAEYGISKTELGGLLAMFGVAYGLSKFLMGVISDKSNPRYYVATGLIGSAVLTLLLGTTRNLFVMGFLMCILALFQGMGAPAAHKVISSWWHARQRGTVLSVWNTSHNIGGSVVAPLVVFATSVGGTLAWAEHFPKISLFPIFAIPAVVSLILGVIIILLGRDRPTSVGLPSIEDFSGISDGQKSKDAISADGELVELTSMQIFVKYILKSKYCWFLFFANAGVYLARYGISDWIPLYLEEGKGFDADFAKYCYSFFELSAIPITILLGLASDRLFKSKRAIIGVGLGILNVLLIFGYIYAKDTWLIITIICLFGATVYGSQMLTATLTMELVPKFAVGALTGFIALAAYLIGEVCAGIVVPLLVGDEDNPNWTIAFTFVGVAAILSVIFFFLLMAAEKHKDSFAAGTAKAVDYDGTDDDDDEEEAPKKAPAKKATASSSAKKSSTSSSAKKAPAKKSGGLKK
ncbi:MAG: MFS transporter [Bifidobacteriaceae bacterium]|jgi:OPA family glycerol-3-phosphate transporter-like MFS transporter|nr:MFS transporter [Bifidobacteriaceae bacterium]